MSFFNFNTTPIDRVASIEKSDFCKHYYQPQLPLVISDWAKHWPACKKWSFDYFKQKAANIEVPLYDNRRVTAKYNYNEPHEYMTLGDYLDLLQQQPTDYRIFLFNLVKQVPELKQDFDYPEDLGISFLKKLPFLFFGGAQSSVLMHYDIDFANIFHVHFSGKKRCLLFPPSDTKYLYKLPNSLKNHEDVDFLHPDVERFPALKEAKGFEVELQPGETLYMPEGFWHFMYYETAGFSMSLRALPRSGLKIAKAAYNIGIMRHTETLMRKIAGDKWIDWQKQTAIQRSEEKIKKL